MLDQDELLQQYLDALENGTPLETLLTKIPSESAELSSLLKLAAAVRGLQHPQPAAENSRITHWKILQAAADKYPTRPISPWPARPYPKTRPQTGTKRPQPVIAESARPARQFPVPMWSTLIALLLLAIVSSAGLGVWLYGPPGSHLITLMDVSGAVEATPNSSSYSWHPIQSGDQLRSGQMLRTGANGHAILVFFDGTRTVIKPNSRIALSKISGGWGNQLRVSLDEQSGNISNSVVPLRGKNSQFVVKTPSGQASVRGTHFSVEVGKNGQALYSVSTGQVLVTNAAVQVALLAGQATTTQPGSQPAAPAYQFSVQGILTTKQNSEWVVSGVIFEITGDTQIDGNPNTGDMLIVQGRILENGKWVADSIEPSGAKEPVSTFMGKITSMSDGKWEISGVSVLTNGQTYFSQGLGERDSVKVTFITQSNGQRQALRIESLEDTQNPNANPDLEFIPGDVQASGCKSDYSLNGSLVNQGNPPEDYASNVELSYVILSGEKLVQNVDLSPATWDQIDAGETVNFTINVALKDGWDTLSQGSQIKLRVFIAHEINRPENLTGRLFVTVTSNCRPNAKTITPSPSPTVTLTPTPTITPTIEITSTANITSGISVSGTVITNCVGVNPQPEALKLVDEYGVKYEVIMRWFCQGYGFGEIKDALDLSRESGVSIDQIFADRESGQGWGQIKKNYGEKDKGPGKPKDKIPPGRTKSDINKKN